MKIWSILFCLFLFIVWILAEGLMYACYQISHAQPIPYIMIALTVSYILIGIIYIKTIKKIWGED